jgi:hypothetical protein
VKVRVPLALTSSSWMSTRPKAPVPVILKFPPPSRLKLLQSKDHSMRQVAGAWNPGLVSVPLPLSCHRGAVGLLVGSIDAGGVVVVGLVTVVGTGWCRWSPAGPPAGAPASRAGP